MVFFIGVHWLMAQGVLQPFYVGGVNHDDRQNT